MAAGHGVNFVNGLFGPASKAAELFEPILSALIVVSVLWLFVRAATKQLRASTNALVPDNDLSAKNLAELLVEFVLKLGDNVMGKENRKYLPFVGTIFIYVALGNLFGLTPGFSTPNDSLHFNLGLGLTVFILYNYWGIKEQGLGNYIKHFWGPLWVKNPAIWLIGLLIFVVECISHGIRPVSLSIRLFANMTADHAVLQAFTDLTKFGIPVIFYFMGTFVCLMQAFIYALLTMIYIRLAVAHEEGHEEH